MRLSLCSFARRIPGVNDPLHSGLGEYSTDFSNLPQRYLKRKSTKLKYKSPLGVEYKTMFVSNHIKRHTMDRPWTSQFWMKNPAFRTDGELPIVEPIKAENWMWFRGDRVEILTGLDKGKQGYINMIIQERNWVTVEGMNCKYESVGSSGDFPGVIMKDEKPLLVTRDIKLVDPSDEKPSEVQWRITESGERVRVSVRTGTEIPIPTKSEETLDYRSKSGYQMNKTKDTRPNIVEEVTYEPSLATFEMDIMRQMGIEETRVPKKTWWY